MGDMGYLKLNLGEIEKGIAAKVAFVSGLETIPEHNSNLLLHGRSFQRKSEDEAFVLKKI